jgi:hypothetical protein
MAYKVKSPKLTRWEKIAEREADRRVDYAFNARCKGIPIPIMRLPDIMKHGHAAIARGVDDATLGDIIAAMSRQSWSRANDGQRLQRCIRACHRHRAHVR